MKISERRIHTRIPLKTRVVFEDEHGEGLFYVFSEDLSMGGLFLASDIPMKVGTLLFISFSLPGHKRPVRVTGEVVRRVASKQQMTGMGVRFVGLSEITHKRLEDFFKSHS